MSRTDPSAATGRIPVAAVRCRCGHFSTLHVLYPIAGYRGKCSASTCDCKRFEQEEVA